MKKIVFLIICLFIPITIYSLEFPTVNSKIVEIYDLNDKKILYEIGSNEVTSIASLTKIVTTITAIENIENLDEEVIITYSILKTVSPEASVAGLKVGDKLTYRDLLYASMLPSGADATNSIAILSSGSIDNFVNKMNDLAKKIGLTNTHFKNVTGLDDKNHYSTADDIRKILEYALKNETFKKIYTTKKYTMTNGVTVKSTLYKYGASDLDINKIIGSKTGFTFDAGYCLSSLSNINNHDVITVVIKADKNYSIKDTITLIDFMNNNYNEETLIEKNRLIKTLPVNLSKTEKYKVYSDKKVTKYLPSDYDKNKFKIKYTGLKELSYKNHKGDKIGVVKYYYDNEVIYKQDIFLNKNIDLDFIKLIKKYHKLIIIIISILLLIIIIKCKRKNT